MNTFSKVKFIFKGALMFAAFVMGDKVTVEILIKKPFSTLDFRIRSEIPQELRGDKWADADESAKRSALEDYFRKSSWAGKKHEKERADTGPIPKFDNFDYQALRQKQRDFKPTGWKWVEEPTQRNFTTEGTSEQPCPDIIQPDDEYFADPTKTLTNKLENQIKDLKKGHQAQRRSIDKRKRLLRARKRILRMDDLLKRIMEEAEMFHQDFAELDACKVEDDVYRNEKKTLRDAAADFAKHWQLPHNYTDVSECLYKALHLVRTLPIYKCKQTNTWYWTEERQQAALKILDEIDDKGDALLMKEAKMAGRCKPMK